jgi:hypothetical protein
VATTSEQAHNETNKEGDMYVSSRILLTMAIIAAASVSAKAEKVLAQKLECYFDSGTYHDNGKNEPTTEKMKLTFVVSNKGSFMVGNQGASPVEWHSGSSGQTFIEKLDSGAVMTMTVATDNKSKRRPAVYTRHAIFLGLLPQQYYGTCELQ